MTYMMLWYIHLVTLHLFLVMLTVAYPNILIHILVYSIRKLVIGAMSVGVGSGEGYGYRHHFLVCYHVASGRAY